MQAAGFFLQGQDAADADVLTLTIPVHEQAKPRSIQITGHEDRKKVTAG